MIGCMNNPQNG